MALPIVFSSGQICKPGTLIPILFSFFKERGTLPCYGWFEYTTVKPGPLLTTPHELVLNDYTIFTQSTAPLEYQYMWKFRAAAQNPEGSVFGEWINFWPPINYKPLQGGPWIIKSSSQEWLGTTLKHTVQTDIQCHLKAKISDTPTWSKRTLQSKRGIAYRGSPVTYFPYRFEVEQAESGDTLQHTILIPGFTPQIPFYWLYNGTVDSKPSLSRSGLFSATLP